MSTQAETKLRELIQAGRIGPTGHAPEVEHEAIMLAAGRGERMSIVESDEAGYPKITEKWDALRFADKSLLIVTYVRGNPDVAFWKAIENIDNFEVWCRFGEQAHG